MNNVDRLNILPDDANQVWAVRWCRQHNARVRFWSNGDVSVHVNNRSTRRKAFALAVAVLADRLGTP